MKSFQSYIFELNHPYEFRIKIGSLEPKGEVLEKIKNAINTYQLESISKVKSVPIQAHKEFPQWGACESWQFDVKIAYPTTAEQLRQVIKERAGINPSWIHVRDLQEAENTEEAEANGKDHKGALLNDPVLADVEGQSYAGQKRVDSLLKELETRKYEFAQKSKETGKSTNDTPVQTKSPMGTTQNKISSPVKGTKNGK